MMIITIIGREEEIRPKSIGKKLDEVRVST